MADGEFADLRATPSWMQYFVSCKTLENAMDQDDPEDTLMVQLTVSELALVCLSVMVVQRIFPELTPIAHRFGHKLEQLNAAQEYLSGPSSTTDEE